MPLNKTTVRRNKGDDTYLGEWEVLVKNHPSWRQVFGTRAQSRKWARIIRDTNQVHHAWCQLIHGT